MTPSQAALQAMSAFCTYACVYRISDDRWAPLLAGFAVIFGLGCLLM